MDQVQAEYYSTQRLSNLQRPRYVTRGYISRSIIKQRKSAIEPVLLPGIYKVTTQAEQPGKALNRAKKNHNYSVINRRSHSLHIINITKPKISFNGTTRNKLKEIKHIYGCTQTFNESGRNMFANHTYKRNQRKARHKLKLNDSVVNLITNPTHVILPTVKFKEHLSKDYTEEIPTPSFMNTSFQFPVEDGVITVFK